MQLLFDVGNSRLKWAQLHAGQLNGQAAVSHKGLTLSSLRETLRASVAAHPEGVLIANVGGNEIAELLATALEQEWSITAEFVESTTELAGVQNGYTTPAQLGVDRWLALVAAYSIAKGAICIASVGTALTLDAVDADANHLGGTIIPGPDMMIESLLKNTAEIAKRSEVSGSAPDLLATDTRSAIYEGAIHAPAALIERFVERMAVRTHTHPQLFLTGGASVRILPALRVPCRQIPDLVLQGLCFEAARRSRQ